MIAAISDLTNRPRFHVRAREHQPYNEPALSWSLAAEVAVSNVGRHGHLNKFLRGK
jgi:hypothetical protein